jgi:hypothetical protein
MTHTIVPSHSRTPTRASKSRRGVALYIVMVFVIAIAVMALTAIVTSGNATLVAKSYARENDLAYAAEAALAIGKSRINFDASALPDTGYKVLLQNAQLKSADDAVISGVTVTVYAGPSGSTSGQFGRFASVVAEARDQQGNGFVRRLELSQESFAKFAYWSQDENPGGTTIYFGSGDQLWGPVWSNDNISIMSSGATFNDDIATAKTISGKSYGTFRKGYKENQKPITLPTTASLASKLLPLATAAGWNFTAPTTGSASGVRMRIEFVAVDLNNNGDSSGTEEGFFKVYTGTTAGWTRADGQGTTVANVTQCGDWHPVVSGGPLKFFPASVHPTTWFRDLMVAGGMSTSSANSERDASLSTIMGHSNARCYLGGSPQLVAVERTAALGYATSAIQKGGDDTTFTPTDQFGAWTLYSATPNATVAAKRPHDAQYLFPIHRSLNTNAKGVIHVTGTVGVSGVISGKLTVYTSATGVVLDDLRYANDPGTGRCQDIFGFLAAKDIVVADNAINTAQDVSTSGTTYRIMDDTKDLYLHGVMMALDESFEVENVGEGPSSATSCDGTSNGRGCLYLTGGLIQVARGIVSIGSQGYIKRYSYDRCAIVNPPPYFPTTGRFTDNRYYELDPVGFNAANLYKAITPDK